MKTKTLRNLPDLDNYQWNFCNYESDKQIQIYNNCWIIESVLPTLNIEDVFATNKLKETEEINPIYGDRYISVTVSKGYFSEFYTKIAVLDILTEGKKLIGYNTNNLSNLDEAAVIEITKQKNKYTLVVNKIKVKPDFNTGLPVFGTYIEV